MGDHTGTRAGLKSFAQYGKARTVPAVKTHVRPKESFDFEHLTTALPDAKPE